MLKSLLFYALLAQGADLTTTVIGLNRGCTELTHPAKSPVAIVATKGGAVVLFSLMYPGLKRDRPKLTAGLTWGLLASGVAATAVNMHTLPLCR